MNSTNVMCVAGGAFALFLVLKFAPSVKGKIGL